MATIPSNYDSSSISVEPYALNSCAQAIKDAVTSIGDLMSSIQCAIDGLMLPWTGDPSWSGDAASAASEMDNRWDQVTATLYGTKDDPNKGILNVLASGLSAAAVNYSTTESSVATMFNKFGDAVSGINPNAGVAGALITVGEVIHDPSAVAAGEAVLGPQASQGPQSVDDQVSNNYRTTAVDVNYNSGSFGDAEVS